MDNIVKNIKIKHNIMANEYVKFYRLGSSSNDSSVSYEQYQSYITGDASVGGIVFARVYDPEKNKTTQFIWANGIEYNLGAGSSNAKIDVSTADPSVYFEGKTPSHGDYYVKEEYVSDNVNVEPKRTAYIFDSTLDNYAGDWVALDGNVNATNVYFPEGFLRTKAWGTQGDRTEIKSDDIQGKNLKEVLEFYLVEELWPSVSATTGTASATTYAISINKPGSIASYMNKSATLAFVDTVYTFNGMSIDSSASHNGPASINGTKSTISGMANGSTIDLNIDVNPNLKSVERGPLTATAEYTTNFNDASITAVLDVSGFTGIDAVTKNVGVEQGDTLVFSSDSGTIVEGNNTITLSWVTDASVSRTLTPVGDDNIPAMTYYYASNKGNVNNAHAAQTNAVEWSNVANATKPTYTTTSFTVKGVYGIFTNGVKNTKSSAGGIGESNANFKWSDNNTYHDQESTSANYTKWDLWDNSSNRTMYINVGNFSGDDSGNQPIVFIPKKLGLSIETGSSHKVATASIAAGVVSGFGASSLYFAAAEDVTLDGVEYKMYKIVGEFGATCLKVELKK